MSLALLLEAVRVVEENKNGSLPHDARAKRKENKRSNSYRSTHNQLEKNRRAHLKHLLDHLRATVPAKGEMKQTTLNLLQSARCYIKQLETEQRKMALERDQVCQKNRLLTQMLLNLGGNAPISSPRKRLEMRGCGHPPSKLLKLESQESDSDVDIENDSDDCSSMVSTGSDGTAVDSK